MLLNENLNIRRGKFDTNKYRYLKLDNEMKVLLISDERAKNAAVALTVNVGNLDDPYGLDGCAHLCEHMLF
jgi:secreted Zn-dependent insulinase-like peptidase